MHGLLAPVLAQVVTLALGDRLEGRYIIDRTQHYFESSNSATVGGVVTIDWRRSTLSFGYAPSLTIVPLEEKHRDVSLVHRAFISGGYRWRRTTLNLIESASFGNQNFRQNALAPNQVPIPRPDQAQATPPAQNAANGGTAPNGANGSSGTGGSTTGAPPTTPTTPAAAVPAVVDQARYGTFRSALALEHIVSHAVSLRFTAGYVIAGGLDADARVLYPVTRGPDAVLGMSYTVDTRNVFSTTLTSAYTSNDAGNNGFIAVLAEDYSHQFTRHTTGSAGIGVAFTRTEPAESLPLYSIYPTARASISHTERLARGDLTFSASVSTSPALDIITATVDPRIGFGLSAGWSRDRFSLSATASSSISLNPDGISAFSAVFSSLSARYDLGAGFLFDTGVRGVWQAFQGTSTIEPSVVFFAGVSWGTSVPLNPSHNTPRQRFFR